MTAKIVYEGELRTSALHLASGQALITDAPLDNQGRGEAFSPTDLLCASLASCLLTIMGILAERQGWPLKGATVEVKKHMAASPRRVAAIDLHCQLPAALEPKARQMLEQAAKTCPVALSLHPDIEQNMYFSYDL